MAKEERSLETVSEIIRDVRAKYDLKAKKYKKPKKNNRLTETDIDLFDEDEKKQ